MKTHVLLFFIFLFWTQCQIRRNIAYTFLQMDKNGDLLLDAKELFPNDEDLSDIGEEHRYTWDTFQYLFPILKHLEWDTDKDYDLSEEQFRKLIQEDFVSKQTKLKGFKSFSTLFSNQQIYKMCQSNGVISPKSLAICMGVWIGFEKDLYEYKLPSIYKRDSSTNTTINYAVFRKAITQSDEDLPKQSEKKIKKMYKLFENQLDDDKVLDNNEIKLMEPTLLISLLDRDNNLLLNFEEAKFIFSDDYGGQKAFKFADINKDGKLSKHEFVAHLVFALDLDDIKSDTDTEKQEDEKNNQL